MIYTYSLKVPIKTEKTSPIEKEVEVEGEIIDTIQIVIPWGHGALAGLAIFYGLEQIAPRPTGMWFRGNDQVIEWRELFTIPGRKAKLKLVGYNDDDSYSHTFIVRFVVHKRRVAMIHEVIERLIGWLERFFISPKRV